MSKEFGVVIERFPDKTVKLDWLIHHSKNKPALLLNVCTLDMSMWFVNTYMIQLFAIHCEHSTNSFFINLSQKTLKYQPYILICHCTSLSP